MKSNDNIPAAEMRLAERIAREALANQKFASETPEKQRVTIAKDVIKWLRTGRLFAGHYYMGLTSKTPAELAQVPAYEHYDARLECEPVVNGHTCVACGIGSLFACAVERGLAGGDLRVSGYVLKRLPRDAYDIWHALAPLYDKDQLLLIECAYEGDKSKSWPSGGTPGPVYSAALETHGSDVVVTCWPWRETIADDSKRMEAIMRNIIRNKGTFVPTDLVA